MPDFVPQAGLVQCRITGTHVSGKKLFNIVNVYVSVALPTGTEVQNVAVTTQNWVQAQYRTRYSGFINVTEIRARSMAQEPGPVYTIGNIGIVGALTGDMHPLSTTQCCNLLTGLTGLSNRGKFFTFAADETVLTAGLYTAAYVTSVENMLSELADAYSALGYTLSVWSRHNQAVIPITGYNGNPIPAHLRSRRIDKGI